MTTRASSTAGWGTAPEGPHGDEPRRCTATAKATGLRCERAPIKGGAVCYVHGGRAKQVQAAAARRLAAEKVEREVRQALADEGVQASFNPLDELHRVGLEARAMRDRLADVIEQMPTWRYTAHGAGTEQLRAEVALYERAMDRSAKVADLLLKSGFEERRVALAEAQGQMVAGVIRAVLGRLLAGVVEMDALSADPVLAEAVRRRWAELVPVVVPEELRKLAGPTVPGEVVRR